jgi:hypothetical protein
MTGGANHVSLIEGQRNFARHGACEIRFQSKVRGATPPEMRDPEWRPIDEQLDNIETPIAGVEHGRSYPRDNTRLYYWRRTFWRKRTSVH